MAGRGKLASSYEPATQRGTIRVEEPGVESGAQIEAARRGLVQDFSAEVIYLELPLNHPATARVCEEAEQLGFFFSGVAPQPPGAGDWMRLQYLRNPIDLGLLQIARELVCVFKQKAAYEMERVRRGASGLSR